MTVGELCIREVDTVEMEESARDAAARMHARNVGALIVVNGDKRPVGILTDRDLALRVVASDRLGSGVTVGEIMSPEPKCVREVASIEDALAIMRARQVRRVVVVNDERQLTGVLSLDDILELIGEEFRQICKLLDHESPRTLAHL